MPIDYQNGKIYSVRSGRTDKYYIGSTCQSLHKRLYEHRDCYTRFKNNIYHYVSVFDILGFGDEYIELVENYPCNSKDELQKREGELIRKYKSEVVNRRIEGRTKKEWRQDNSEKIKESKVEYAKLHPNYNKDYLKGYYAKNKSNIRNNQKLYYEENKDHIKSRTSKYYENNKSKIALQMKSKHACICGMTYTYGNRLRHRDSKKHQRYQQYINYCEKNDPLMYKAIQIHQQVKSSHS